MHLPYWLHNRLHRGIPRLAINPYSGYDSSVAPKWFMWELYREAISSAQDEREYRLAALEHLREHGTLVEESRTVKDEIKKTDNPAAIIAADTEIAEELAGFGFDSEVYGYPGMPDNGTVLFLYGDNLVCVQPDDKTVKLGFYHPVSKKCHIDDFKDWIVPKRGESRVSVLITRNGSMVASNIAFAPPVIHDLELNYGSGFAKVHERIMGKLKQSRPGLGILHGLPGSGKSTYIKHLTSVIEREFIFIPVNMSDRLGSPEFIDLLIKKKGAVLILEDAEQAVQQRGDGGNDSAVATLLNMSDGILGAILDIKILVTYNADRQHIDKALLRKGRLLFDHDFGPLSAEDARRLAAHLKKDVKITAPMTIADIYGFEEETGYMAKPERQVGFHTLLPGAPDK